MEDEMAVEHRLVPDGEDDTYFWFRCTGCGELSTKRKDHADDEEEPFDYINAPLHPMESLRTPLLDMIKADKSATDAILDKPWLRKGFES